ncbi:MAG: hypothetical protein JNM46_08945, partial [Anaerolineales bacterium]|nr:hypothetical protein [Anaerolineales bacterium]
LQYAETASSINPADTNLRGNLGVMYYRNAFWAEAVQELSYVVTGGLSEDGYEMEVLNLAPNSPRIAEYYFTYGLALSRLNRCGEALQIAQLIISRIPDDPLSVDNANAIIERCQQNLTLTQQPPLPTGTVESTPTP